MVSPQDTLIHTAARTRRNERDSLDRCTSAFSLACGIILVWALTGPLFRYSDTWQLVINTGTTVVTFLMVFLIQRAQNKDSLAVHLKLNEFVAAIEGRATG